MTVEQYKKAKAIMTRRADTDEAVKKLNVLATGNDKLDPDGFRIGLDADIREFRVFHVPPEVFDKVCNMLLDYYKKKQHEYDLKMEEL